MNLVLIEESEISVDSTKAVIRGRRAVHIREVHRAEAGKELKVGLINGLCGTGLVQEITVEHVTLELCLNCAPPEKLPLTLILALPRPKMLRRIMETAAAMGVPRIVLLNSYRVDKSYWQTPVLAETEIRRHLLAGLEQARDTVLPEVLLRRKFKPFAEDELPALGKDTLRLIAHPAAAEPCPRACKTAVTLAVGPDGGFIDYEVEKIRQAGFQAVNLGPRILRVETAVPAILGRLF